MIFQPCVFFAVKFYVPYGTQTPLLFQQYTMQCAARRQYKMLASSGLQN
jgi:hypothetical protein